MNIRVPQAVLLLTAVLFALPGCAPTTTATVVSSSGGPTIQQAQQEPYAGTKKRIAVTAFEFKAARGSGDIGRGMSDMLANAGRPLSSSVCNRRSTGAAGRSSGRSVTGWTCRPIFSGRGTTF